MKLQTGTYMNTDYIYNETCITKLDIEAYTVAINSALKNGRLLTAQGVVNGHMSKENNPEPVLFPKITTVGEREIITPSLLARLEQLQEHVRNNIDAVVVFGIGGSYLGSKVLFDVQCGSFWNELDAKERHKYPRIYFAGFNADSDYLSGVLNTIQRSANNAKNYRVMLIVISKSGGTIEPMSNFIITESYLQEQDIDYEVVAVTDTRESEHTTLYEMAKANDWELYTVPHGIGGRFSVFSEVGLVVASTFGFDCQSFLAGAHSMNLACQQDDLWKNPALLTAVLKYIGAEKYGRVIEVFMPYGNCMKSLSDWYVQLLAESLGKTRENGEPYDRTPVAAIGTTDMHSQVQDHQEGRYNKIVQFIRVEEWDNDLVVPHTYDDYDRIRSFSGVGLNTIMNIALDSNREALQSDNRFNMTLSIPKLNAFHLGEVMFMFCWAIFYESVLAGVDAFNQPGVEVYKSKIGPKLKQFKNTLAK